MFLRAKKKSFTFGHQGSRSKFDPGLFRGYGRDADSTYVGDGVMVEMLQLKQISQERESLHLNPLFAYATWNYLLAYLHTVNAR